MVPNYVRYTSSRQVKERCHRRKASNGQGLSDQVRLVGRDCWKGQYFHDARSIDTDIVENSTVNKGYGYVFLRLERTP